MKSATAFLPMSSASIRSIAMPCLAGTPKDKKYSSLSSKIVSVYDQKIPQSQTADNPVAPGGRKRTKRIGEA